MGSRNKQESVPSFSLHEQNRVLKSEILRVISQCIDEGKFILGDHVKTLEQQIAQMCGVPYAVGVANGSDALYLSLLACGVGPGDEVITTPFTFFATAGSISRVGAKPVFVDIDEQTWNIDASSIEEKITQKTKAIIPVHLYGCPAQMDAITEIAKRRNIKVIEDAAQALGAKFQDKHIGGLGDLCCLSFFPTKNLGAFGDGGMILTSDPELYEKIKLLRVHGAGQKYHHTILGCNSRLDELQAAILAVKQQYLQQWTERRRTVAARYGQLLDDLKSINAAGIKLPIEPHNTYHVYHQYTIQTPRRDQLQLYLQEHGIGSTVYYPIPMHLQKVYASLGYHPGDFPVAERACKEVLSLPMFPELTDRQVTHVVRTVGKFLTEVS